jgi:hypothetical protein
MDMPGGHQVVQDRKACEKLDVLEGSPDPQAGDLMGPKAVDAPIFEDHLSILGLVKTVDAIEDAGFTGAIGSNDGKHLSLFHFETDPGKCGDAAEIQPDIFDP